MDEWRKQIEEYARKIITVYDTEDHRYDRHSEFEGIVEEALENIELFAIDYTIQYLQDIDAAYHHQVEMKTQVSVEELHQSGVEYITLDDPRTQNTVFRVLQDHLTTLRNKKNELYNNSN